jgi:chromate transporter
MKKLWELFVVFFKIGLFTFGGGMAMIPIIKSEIVTKKKWITDDEMLNIIAIAESTPGVIAVNSATFVGYKVGKFWGSLLATIGVVLPSLIIICIIAAFFQDFLNYPYVKEIFKGIRIGVSVLIFNAGIKLFKQSPKSTFVYIIIGLTIVLRIVTNIDAIILILSGATASIIVQLIMEKRKRDQYVG